MQTDKKHLSKLAVIAVLLCVTIEVPAQSIVSTSYQGVESSDQITLPLGMSSVVRAQNVGDPADSVVNGITFAGDTSADGALVPGLHTFSGDGYTADAGTEGSDGVSGASFTQTTLNLAGDGFVMGDPMSGLAQNTDYTFDLFLSDNNAGRGTQFSYDFGGTPTVVGLVQGVGSVNVYQVEFNTESGTGVFNWRMDSSTDFHDAKISGFALFSAAPAPEPSTFALMGLGVGTVVLFRRRQKLLVLHR